VSSLPGIDTAVFNLPIKPGRIADVHDPIQVASTSAGDGSAHTVAALDGLSRLLPPGGRVFFNLTSVTNIKAIQAALDRNYTWTVLSRIWIPWRHFEHTQKESVDQLVRTCMAYYRVESGELKEEDRVIEATRK